CSVYPRALYAFPTRRSSDLSPLVTYKSPIADGEGIEVNLALNFYRYLTKTNIKQTIIIENEEPPSDIYNKIHQIKFSGFGNGFRSEEHTSELQSRENLVCRL